MCLLKNGFIIFWTNSNIHINQIKKPSKQLDYAASGFTDFWWPFKQQIVFCIFYE